MRLSTAWWGVQILAETDADAILLRAMLNAVAESPCKIHRTGLSHIHRTGTAYLLTPQMAHVNGFSGAEIAASKFAIEIRV